MSAPLFFVFYGLRYDVSEKEIGALELRNDARQVAARDAGLSSFWGDISGQGFDYKLLVGHQLGAYGPEATRYDALRISDVASIAATVDAALVSAGLDGVAQLHLQWFGD